MGASIRASGAETARYGLLRHDLVGDRHKDGWRNMARERDKRCAWGRGYQVLAAVSIYFCIGNLGKFPAVQTTDSYRHWSPQSEQVGLDWPAVSVFSFTTDRVPPVRNRFPPVQVTKR